MPILMPSNNTDGCAHSFGAHSILQRRKKKRRVPEMGRGAVYALLTWDPLQPPSARQSENKTRQMSSQRIGLGEDAQAATA